MTADEFWQLVMAAIILWGVTDGLILLEKKYGNGQSWLFRAYKWWKR